MTVRSIVEMFENMTVSTGTDQQATQTLESLGRGNVCGLVTYYDGLAVLEEAPMIVSTKKFKFQTGVSKSATPDSTPDTTEAQEESETEESNQETSEVTTECSATTVLSTVARNCSLPVSKIPQPKSREFHLSSACSVRKASTDDSKSTRAFSSSSSAVLNAPSLYVPPPTPVSSRVRNPSTSYAAFVARIESSQSRLLDFEKDDRWLGQVETMKGRVEALKRRNQLALAREVACTPRKSRSMSECSGISTASTASLSSTDTLEQM